MLIKKDHLYASVWAFLAVGALLFNSMFGGVAALIFLIAGCIYAASGITFTLKACRQNWELFLIPALCLVSVVWSDIPTFSLRANIQFLLTTVFAVVIARRLTLNLFLRSSAVVMLIAMLISLFSSRTALNGMTGEISLIGIFNSKNNLATNTAMCIALAITLSMNKKIDFTSRMLGLLLLLISTLVLVKAKSLGAIVFVICSILISFIIVYYQNLLLDSFTRSKLNWLMVLTFLFVICFIVFSLINGSFNEFMYNIGKDPTLTGRTLLWERGGHLIAERPLLGVGFQSLFYIGNNVAEDIWAIHHVPSGAGFNFHNMYVDISVELGLLGLFLYLIFITMIIRKIFNFKHITVGSSHFFAVTIMSYLFLQTFLEAAWFEQFTIIYFFMCISCVYLKEEERYE
ncbi:O-antigen ligase family protein [Pseudoalteromonas sp. 31A1]|uniref:O-antigen ligase family protein n=1 Tax=Pseudoalteromonas sp. 31A1 TaxID=2686351 RepID=UPI0013FDEB0B|nr:O-antigen ligase family protein [Pseudoalteromonas sp. 31A1]